MLGHVGSHVAGALPGKGGGIPKILRAVRASESASVVAPTGTLSAVVEVYGRGGDGNNGVIGAGGGGGGYARMTVEAMEGQSATITIDAGFTTVVFGGRTIQAYKGGDGTGGNPGGGGGGGGGYGGDVNYNGGSGGGYYGQSLPGQAGPGETPGKGALNANGGGPGGGGAGPGGGNGGGQRLDNTGVGQPTGAPGGGGYAVAFPANVGGPPLAIITFLGLE